MNIEFLLDQCYKNAKIILNKYSGQTYILLEKHFKLINEFQFKLTLSISEDCYLVMLHTYFNEKGSLVAKYQT